MSATKICLASPLLKWYLNHGLQVTKIYQLVEKYEADERTYCPQECCERHETYDQKTPGLFKLEAKGDTIVALCSKTYVLQKEDGTYKLSCKGLNKRALGNPLTIYKHVLESCTDASGINPGIRADNTMYTYAQERRAISYFYCKRKYYNSLQSALKEINSPEANTIDAIRVIMKERKPNYVPKGKLLFPGHDIFWSTRLSSPTSQLLLNHPGQNRLGVLWESVLGKE